MATTYNSPDFRQECPIVGKTYRVGEKLGSGSFGDIYMGTSIQTHERVAIKVESMNAKYPQLHDEYWAYQALTAAEGVPKIKMFGQQGRYLVLVMELLGDSLEALYNKCGRRFSLKTVVMIAIQLLHRLEHLHNCCLLHRDIKPDNFLVGTGTKRHIVLRRPRPVQAVL